MTRPCGHRLSLSAPFYLIIAPTDSADIVSGDTIFEQGLVGAPTATVRPAHVPPAVAVRARHVRRNTVPATILSRTIAPWIRPASRINSYSLHDFRMKVQGVPNRRCRAENPPSSPRPTPYTGAACDIASLPSVRVSVG